MTCMYCSLLNEWELPWQEQASTALIGATLGRKVDRYDNPLLSRHRYIQHSWHQNFISLRELSRIFLKLDVILKFHMSAGFWKWGTVEILFSSTWKMLTVHILMSWISLILPYSSLLCPSHSDWHPSFFSMSLPLTSMSSVCVWLTVFN